MVKPSLANLMEKENVNRYALVVATAKCARDITDEYVRQREYVDKNAASVINPKYRDEKAVQIAIEELYDDEYRIVKDTLPEGMGRDYEAEAKAAEEASCEALEAEEAADAEDVTEE